ncbi:MAG: leucine-rich repeat protein [Clostridia bacterium]|nr:leucine-rich repeat protein [Clostridia bacterium]
MTREKSKLKFSLALLICSVFTFFAVILSGCTGGGSGNIFKLENVNKFIIGETKAPEVTNSLGQPYEKLDNNVWCWYENSYIKIDKAMIKAMEDLDEDKLIKLDQQLEDLTFKFIMIRFEDARVAEVFLDINHVYDFNSYFESSEDKVVNTVNLSVDTISGYTIKYDDEYEETYIDVNNKVYSVEFTDGSYYATKSDMFVPEYSDDKSQVTLKFSDSITDHEVTKPFVNKYTVDGEGTLIDWTDKTITELVLDENIVKIPMDMFEDFTNLTKITYAGTKNDWVRYHGAELTYEIVCSDGVMGVLSETEIEASPFIFEDNTGKKITGVKDTTMTEIVIPYYVESIADGAFDECTSAKSLIVLSDVSFSIDFWKKCPLEYIEGPDSLYRVSSNKQSQLAELGYDFSTIKEIVITSFADYYGRLYDQHNNFFNNCANLESITIAKNAKNSQTYATLGGILYTKNFAQIERIPKALKTIIIPKSWTSIPNGTFDGSYENVIFEEGSQCETIERNVFGEITKSFIAPESMKTIKSLNLTASVETLYLPTGLETCTPALKGKNMTIPAKFLANVTEVENLTFNAGTTEDIETSMENELVLAGLRNISVEDEVDINVKGDIIYNEDGTKIILAHRLGLGEVSIPTTVVEIGKYAFYCSDIQELDFDNRLTADLTTISESAFESCYRLRRVILPANLETIGDNAFMGCNLLLEALNLSDIEIQYNKSYSTPRHDGYLSSYVKNEIHSSSDLYSKTKLFRHDGFIVYIDDDKNEQYIIDYVGTSKEVEFPSHMTINDNIYKMEVMYRAFYCIDWYDFDKITLKAGVSLVDYNIFTYSHHGESRKLRIGELVIEPGVVFDEYGYFSDCNIGKATMPVEIYNSFYVRNIGDLHLTGEGEIVSRSYAPKNLYLPNTITGISQGAFNDYAADGLNIYFDGTKAEFDALLIKPLLTINYRDCWRINIYCSDATIKYMCVSGIDEYNSIELGENEYLYGLSIRNVETYTADMFAEHEYLRELQIYTSHSIYYPSQITIQANAFNGCDNLKYIHTEGLFYFDEEYDSSFNLESGWNNGLGDYEIIVDTN